MVELTKQQKKAIKAVGKACDGKSEKPIIRFVYSDGVNIYGTNAQILFMERGVRAPIGAYTPKEADCVSEKIKEDIDENLKKLHTCEEMNAKDGEKSSFFYQSKNAFDMKYKKELYQITFAYEEGGHFQTEDLFLKRLIDKAVAFVGKGFSLYQNAPRDPCGFESKDGKRLAFVMPILRTQDIKILNDVDLNGGKK